MSSGVSDQARHKLTCSATETSLKFRIYKLEVLFCLGTDIKGADQAARMHKLICAFVVRIWHKTHFLMAGSNYACRFASQNL